MRKLIILLFTVFSNLIYSQVSNEILDKNFMEATKWKNDVFVVINLKDNKTQKFEEVCVTTGDLVMAIREEKNIEDEEAFNLLMKSTSRNFEFLNPKAILSLGAKKFSLKELSDFEDKVNINEEIRKINKDWFWDFEKQNNAIKGKEHLYGYSLSKKGFIIGLFQECFGLYGLWCLSCQKE